MTENRYNLPWYKRGRQGFTKKDISIFHASTDEKAEHIVHCVNTLPKLQSDLALSLQHLQGLIIIIKNECELSGDALAVFKHAQAFLNKTTPDNGDK